MNGFSESCEIVLELMPELKESDEGINQDVRTLGDHALEAIKNEVSIIAQYAKKKKKAFIKDRKD